MPLGAAYTLAKGSYLVVAAFLLAEIFFETV